VREFRTRLEAVIERVQRAIRDGATRDDIAQRVDVSDLDWPLAATRIRDVFDEVRAAR
jgi:hypothetical protein